MICKEYLNAARRHKETCKLLIKSLDEIGYINDNILKNLYYITGYIIECSIKYAILTLNGHPRTRDIKYFCEHGINYDDHIRYHRFEAYDRHLQKYSLEAPFIDRKVIVEKNIVELYKNWDSNLRYSCELKYPKDIYFKFYKCACSIMDKITERTLLQ